MFDDDFGAVGLHRAASVHLGDLAAESEGLLRDGADHGRCGQPGTGILLGIGGDLNQEGHLTLGTPGVRDHRATKGLHVEEASDLTLRTEGRDLGGSGRVPLLHLTLGRRDTLRESVNHSGWRLSVQWPPPLRC